MKQKTFKKLQPGIESLTCCFSDFLAGWHPSNKHKIFRKKTSVQILFSLIFMVLCSIELIGQEPVVSYDTIRFERNGNGDFDYLVSNSKIKTIGFNNTLSEDVKADVLLLAMVGQWFIYSNKEPG